MKSPRLPFRLTLIETTALARETLADVVYASASVKAALSAEAGKGFTAAAIVTATAVDLRETRAAHVLVEWLNHEGFRTEWSGRADPAGTHAYAARFWDLVVSWDPKAI